MMEFPFSFDKHYNDSPALVKLNTEWSLQCLWSTQPAIRPGFLEICRQSTDKDTMVSGTVKVMNNGILRAERKFLQLIEAGAKTSAIQFNYADNSNYRSNSIIGTLKISAEMPDNEYKPDNKNPKGIQFKSLLDLSDNFERLLDPKATYFSDVSINCGTVSFPAHKNILSARSEVFASMFSNQMKESRNNRVDITDLSPEVLKTMLTYIYCGKTGELSVQSASELLFAADKYQLQDLKRVCCDHLKSCVSTDNVLKTLVLGYLHDEDLKEFAIDSICNKCEEFEVLEKTGEWRQLREKIPSLAMDVLTGLVKQGLRQKSSAQRPPLGTVKGVQKETGRNHLPEDSDDDEEDYWGY